ncbi:DUF4913 domain-containing protein [Micromonospora sp. WMMD980]|uniref:DUF4913 domain-containing protein n=1 Tax=Micromonospora sp. WMMD980 TaxID=3016088 RepID=UPI002417EBFB|nr:DUF4913 domain-containing protein [Micromonospora sp. WMMD980]MDG4800290.1 DUF4913 domain-containing protein [Micromonospora sp. WMMD980]
MLTDEPARKPFFILYLDGPEYAEELRRLGGPAAAGRRRRGHLRRAVVPPKAAPSDPAAWHQNHLWPTMGALRDPAGPFAGCKPDGRRPKDRPYVERYDDG